MHAAVETGVAGILRSKRVTDSVGTGLRRSHREGDAWRSAPVAEVDATLTLTGAQGDCLQIVATGRRGQPAVGRRSNDDRISFRSQSVETVPAAETGSCSCCNGAAAVLEFHGHHHRLGDLHDGQRFYRVLWRGRWGRSLPAASR